VTAGRIAFQHIADLSVKAIEPHAHICGSGRNINARRSAQGELASVLQNRDQTLQKRDIKSGFDDDAPSVGEFHTQTAAHRWRADQIDGEQVLACSCCAASATPAR